MTLTDQHIDALLAECKKGSQRAQLEVYNRYYHAMYNTSLRIVKKTAVAEDIMQEAFLRAFTKLDSFSGEGTFGSWLKRIVVNQSINHYQKQQKRAEVPLEDQLYKLEDESTGIVQTDVTNVKVQQVLRAMDTLKDNYRVALSLHLIEGYDYEEMSGILGISYANCRTVVSRAKEKLRQQFKIL